MYDILLLYICSSAGSSDGHARLCDVESGDVVSTYSGHQKAIVTVALNDMVDENE